MKQSNSGLLVPDHIDGPMMRGSGSVELLCERGKKVLERVDFENFIANPGKDYLKNWTRRVMADNHPSSGTPFNTYVTGPFTQSISGIGSLQWFKSDYPAQLAPFSTLTCLPYSGAEDPTNERLLPGISGPVAYALRNTNDGNNATYQGTINRLESILDTTKTKLVFDWATSSGNGTFQSLCWSNVYYNNFTASTAGVKPWYGETQTDESAVDSIGSSGFAYTPDGSAIWAVSGGTGAWLIKCYQVGTGNVVGGTPTINVTAQINPSNQTYLKIWGASATYVWAMREDSGRTLYRYRVSDGGLDGTIDLGTVAGDATLTLYSSMAGGCGSVHSDGDVAVFWYISSGTVNGHNTKYAVFNPTTGAGATKWFQVPHSAQVYLSPIIDPFDKTKVWLYNYTSQPNGLFPSIFGAQQHGRINIPAAAGSNASPTLLTTAMIDVLNNPFTSSNTHTMRISPANRRWTYSGAGDIWWGTTDGTLGARTLLGAPVTKSALQTMKITYQFDYA